MSINMLLSLKDRFESAGEKAERIIKQAERMMPSEVEKRSFWQGYQHALKQCAQDLEKLIKEENEAYDKMYAEMVLNQELEDETCH